MSAPIRKTSASASRLTRRPRSLRFPPAAEQREVEAHRGAGHERGVGLELRRVALALAVEEAFEVGALVAARLVVDDPEPARVAEDAVHDEGARARGRARAEPKLRPRLRMRAEDPAAAVVG